MGEMYTFNVGDLINELTNIDKQAKVHIRTHDDMEYEVTMAYFDEAKNKVFLRGDQRFEEGWWKF